MTFEVINWKNWNFSKIKMMVLNNFNEKTKNETKSKSLTNNKTIKCLIKQFN